MATDITALLIQMIKGGSTLAKALEVNGSALDSSADLLSRAANYVQILGTAAGPAAQAVVAAELGRIAAQQADHQIEAGAAAEASALASAEAAGAVALLVLALAAILTLAGGTNQSDLATAFQDLTDAINTLGESLLAGYWQGKLTNSPAAQLWIPLKGDLDDLARQGTGGNYVTTDVSHYHNDGMNFVNELTNNLEVSSGFGIGQYWQVPAQPTGDIPQSPNPNAIWDYPGWKYESWYGNFPARLAIANSPSGNVLDPRTMIPVLALGLQSYITLQSVVNLVDSTQPTLSQFLNQFWPDFSDPTSPTSYINFLYLMYQLAVNGIVKTDLPSEQEILGALWRFAQQKGVWAHPSTNPAQPTNYSWGAPEPTILGTYPPGGTNDPGPAFSGNGFSWNGTYGASETYPQYGFYGNYQLDQNKRNLFTQAYFVSLIDNSNAVSQWLQSDVIFAAESELYASMYVFETWTIPWLQNRIILGSMARWKAIYLLNGFDRVWSVLQALQRLAPPSTTPIVPPTMTLKQDGMIASGNWSVRELCKVVKGELLTGKDNQFVIDYWYPEAPVPVGWVPLSGYSVGELVVFLYNLANGDWAGPPEQDRIQQPPRPLSFRGLLAGAAA